jgi:peptidyl-prolyl cis-trans isomerase B (cyclophilin B)
VRALGKLDVDGVKPFLAARLGDEDCVVATAAAEGIGERGYKEATPDLIAAYRARQKREDVDVHLEILRTLQKFDTEAMGQEAVTLLRECIDDPDKRVRTLAAESLAKLGLAVPPMRTDREFYEAAFDRARREQLSPPMGTARAVISTRHGEVEVELFSDDATQTVANFIALSRQGFYNGLTFHRVVPNFVIQGGDPRGDGWGDAGYFIRSEFNRHSYGAGFVGIAHSGKDTGGCQFFITHSPQPRLDGLYTIFGVVRKGMDVVMKVDQGDEFKVRIVE